jgi:SAM-dependent methyltransferase
MKNKELWQPSKYVYKNGRLRGSGNKAELNPGSLLFADIIAGYYEKYLKIHAKGFLLDLGCGKVPFYQSYKNYITDNICVDWDNSLHPNLFVDYSMDLNIPLLLGNDEFDTIILSDVLEHISNPEQLWSEMFRVLKPGGTLIINVPFLYQVHEQPYDYFRYTRYALELFADNAGFKIIQIEETGGLPEVLTDLIAKGVKHVPVLGISLALFFQKVTSIFIKTNFGKRISKLTSKNFPLGYFLIAKKDD